MKKQLLLFSFLLIPFLGWTQEYFNPNVAIRPSQYLSVAKVVVTDTLMSVTMRVVNPSQIPPFFIKTRKLVARRTADNTQVPLLRSDNAPFLPEKHTFSFKGEILEFTLHFPPLEKPLKYFDIIEQTPSKDFYVQGIILDPDMNRELTRAFRAYQLGDREAALEHFKTFATMDLYFEYGLAYFNVIFLCTELGKMEEAKEWYEKFENRFFFDKELLRNQMAQMGILNKLQ